ncbi:hypothetical protein B0H16DRAFT_1503779, partial [Mycena metata]
RQRTDSSQAIDVDLTRLTRSSIWHDDGSVVLQAETTLFRVHWTILALQSSFFRDMRDLPQPADQPSIEGCPLIELQDSSKDVEHLLDALYNQLVFSEKCLPASSFSLALFRLGRGSSARGTLENPTTLDEYDALQDGSSLYLAIRRGRLTRSCGDRHCWPVEHNLLAVLPCALLRVILCHPLERIFDGAHGNGGFNPTLSVSDQQLCILASEKGVEAQWSQDRMWSWFSSDERSQGCIAGNQCAVRKRRLFRQVVRQGVPFAPFQMTSCSGLCPQCNALHLEILAEGRKKLWENLPSFFDLPPWDELKNDV